MRPHLATLLDDFRSHAMQRALAQHTGNRSRPATYAALATSAARVAAELERRGIGAGERVLLWGQNSAAWIAAFYGCLLRGVLAVPLDAAGDSGFAARIIAETTPRLLIGDAALLARLPSFAIPRLPLDPLTGSFDDPLPPPSPVPLAGLSRSTPLQILFTSGTTSEPKGIVHTHGNVLASLDPIEREIARYRRYERPFHPLRFLHTLPLSHVFGQFMGLWVPPLLAAEVHLQNRLDAPRLIEIIRQERISVLAAVPRVLELLRAHLLRTDATLLSRLLPATPLPAWQRWWRFRHQHHLLGWKFWALVTGGATLPEDLEQFWTQLGFALIQGYGMTETTALVTLNHPFHVARGTIGKPLAGREVRVADDGEILVRGESVAGTEWRDGRAQPRVGGEGWLHTGDLAASTATGELSFRGRKSDVIVTAAGLNIHPPDLEAALAAQPGVRAACVFAFDSATGPQPAAALLLYPGAEAEAAVAAANRRLADYQQVRRWLTWPDPDLPRTTNGKVRRREVAARAQLAFALDANLSLDHDPLLTVLGTLPGVRLANVHDSSRLSEDLGLDSLGRMELQSAVEQQFALELPEAAWQDVRTVGALRALLTPASGSVADAVTHALPAPPADDSAAYPRWPWSLPVRWLRVAFLECITLPLVRVLLAPDIPHPSAPLQTPLLIVANHGTAFDVPLVLAALPPALRRHTAVAMAARLLTGWRHARTERHRWAQPLAPLAYWLVTALFNVFPLPQGAGFRSSFAHAGAALDRGMSVLLFPEGRRSADGTLAPFQAGIGLLARESGVPVLPVVLRGLGEIKLRRRHWLRPGNVAITVAKPLVCGAEETPQAFTARLEACFRALATPADALPPAQNTSR